MLERWRLQAVDIVQKAMIEPILNAGKGFLQIVEMEDDARHRIRLARDHHAHVKRVAMYACVRMPDGSGGQNMRGLEAEIFIDARHDDRGDNLSQNFEEPFRRPIYRDFDPAGSRYGKPNVATDYGSPISLCV